ncbi:hypothetical protein CNR22_12155 [Sphingobacteriaceae bacterium]|nr:hypothetical protein CNR22_12155 [Sphingobacteriaceae bacterium]
MNKDQISIFIVDDDKILSTVLKNEIRRSFPEENMMIYIFEAGEICQSFMQNKPDIAIVDYHMNSRYKDAINGIAVIDIFKKESPDTNVILFTKEENMTLAMEAFDHGAHDYVVKNEFMFRRLHVALVQCLRLKRIKQDLSRQRKRGKIAVYLMTLLLACAMVLQFVVPGFLLSKSV